MWAGRLSVVCVAAMVVAGCGRWSADEQRQIEAFRLSIVKVQEASGAQGTGIAMSPAEIVVAIQALREALSAADTVTDPVLARLHPELPEQYRTRFVVGLRLRIAALDALGTGAPLTAEALAWQLPMAAWGAWYDRALPTLRQNIGG